MSKSTHRQKYNITAKFPSTIGFADKSYKKGDPISLVTQFSFFNTLNFSDDEIIKNRGMVNDLLTTSIFPMIFDSYSGKRFPKNFQLTAVCLEMFGDESKNKMTINRDTNIHATCKLKPNIKIKKNQKITFKQIEHYIKFKKLDRDPNAAIILLVRLGGDWFGQYDLIYNRQNVREKIDRAAEFFRSCMISQKNKDYNAFYQSLWDCYELLIECILLLHKTIQLRADHKTIQRSFKIFCQTHKIPYNTEYEKIRDMRLHARYGPPHPENRQRVKKANKFLMSTYNFFWYVVEFLRERQVVLDDKTMQRISITDMPFTKTK